MKLGYKIAIGTAIGFAVGYTTWRIIYNHRRKSAEATYNQQKELLIQQILILQGIPDNESNRNIWRQKTVEQLQQWLEQNTVLVNPPITEIAYDPSDFNVTPISSTGDYASYMSVSDTYGSYIASGAYGSTYSV